MERNPIILKKVKVHNLKDVNLEFNTNELIVFTGVSGSGKSSLAFDTIYVEGQRRYIESLSTFARRYLGDMSKPDVELVSGLSPTISIEQKTASKNPRSTVGTMTEIYDYLRVLYARIAIPHCPVSFEPVRPQSKERIIKTIQSLPSKTKILILSPIATQKKGGFRDDFNLYLRKGYTRARVDGTLIDLSEEISLDKHVFHDVDIVIDRLVVEESNHSRIAEAVTNALSLGSSVLKIVNMETEDETIFSTLAYSPKSGLSYPSLEPHDFSFNSPSGMCPTCHGLGITEEFDMDAIIDPEKSIAQDCCTIASSYDTVRYGNIYRNLATLYDFDIHQQWKHLPERAKSVFLYGIEKKWTPMLFTHPTRDLTWTEYVQWKGVVHDAKERLAAAKSDLYRKRMETILKKQICRSCQGTRLKPYPREAVLFGKKIHEVASMTISECFSFFSTLQLDRLETQISQEIISEITLRLQFLGFVGLHYLTLDRSSPTLSGGESQRVRLASQVGAGLVGVTYVLDEPSIGLHPRDNERLIETLETLRDLGNTVIVVEHDRETILAADRIVDVGPGPGIHGGEIVVNGDINALLKNPRSLTGAYLSGRETLAIPKKRRPPTHESIEIKKASHHNLKHTTVSFPLGLFIAVTGVSGSGKSSLISDTLFPYLANRLHNAEHPVGENKGIVGAEHIDKVIAIDQSPIGRNPRSNPATYIKIFDEIRTLFSTLPESAARGYTPGRFSFNVRAGACPMCLGLGMQRIDMDFLEASYVPCGMCKSKRFDSETLSIYYKGKNIYDVLEMSVKEALDFFGAIPTLRRKLEVIERVGMSYIKLGQPSTTLSGGEAQRIKLAKELSRQSTGNTFYILDEPTTGLHFHDIKALLSVLQELVDKGNTVLVIEHNMDVVKCADWIIDLGPEGGNGGGELIASGTPEQIAKMKTPTGKAVKEALFEKPVQPQPKKKKTVTEERAITVEGASQNNLKGIDLSIPRGKLTICTGPSGSGKSSLAFETVYAEGQRRYIESLSPYARQFVKQMPKAKVEQITGLSPSIAIEQKRASGNPRSTVGTLTEIYDYLRILFALLGTPYSPETKQEIKSITTEFVVEQILKLPNEEKIVLLAPMDLQKQEKFEDLVTKLRTQGYLRIRLNQHFFELDEEISYDKKRKNTLELVIDRIKVSEKHKSRLFEDVEKGVATSQGKISVLRENGEELFFNLAFSDPTTGKAYPTITPHTFSFNSPEGMCPECQGLGVQYGATLIDNVEIMNLTLEGLARVLWTTPNLDLLSHFFKNKNSPLHTLQSDELNLILNGSEKWFETPWGFCFQWQGLQPTFAKLAKTGHPEIKEGLIPLLDEIECPTCQGSRINALARHVVLEKETIVSLCKHPIQQVHAYLQSLSLNQKQKKLLEEVLTQIQNRLEFLMEVGLHYLSLDRRAPTLSNGEAQRIRLARQLGSQLSGVLYVLDEPTIGLHPRDNDRLNTALSKLKNLGNTLLMVEHDPLTLKTADYIYDFGPGAGIHGGHLIAQGTVKEIMKNPHSPTGNYLSGKKKIPVPTRRREAKEFFRIENANVHNLKNLTVDIPIGVMSCLTGVSGSGKSTLMHDVIRPFVQTLLPSGNPFDKLIVIDQDPIGHTVRSDVGTYSDLLPVLRDFYSSLGASRMKGLQPKHFSYNHPKGMCTHCQGLGYKKVELLFLPDVKVSCDVCNGMRLNPTSLEVKYQERTFGDVLNSTVEENLAYFSMLPKAKRIMETLISTGLGYLKLGQEIATLSGGEAQRLKLSKELSKRSTKKTLYLLDEPTTGQHPEDILKLLKVLHQLVDKGNTMILIEHNVDVIKNCDRLFDLGPEAGMFGGYLLAEGTPEEIAKNPDSFTGRYL